MKYNNDFFGFELNVLKLFTYKMGIFIDFVKHYIHWHDIFVLEITKRHLHSHFLIKLLFTSDMFIDFWFNQQIIIIIIIIQ